MDCAENEVSRQGGLGRYQTGLSVPDFAHKYDIGVLTKDRSERRSECQTTVGHDLDLIDERKLVFDRILDGCDVGRDVLYFVQRGVQRRGLSTAGGSADKNDPIGQMKKRTKVAEVLQRESKIVKVDHHGCSSEQAHDNFFTIKKRKAVDTNVENTVGKLQSETSILRHRAFEHIHAAFGFENRCHSLMERSRKGNLPAKHPINPETNHQLVFGRLDMNIARSCLGSPEQYFVYELRDSRVA